MDQAPPNEWTKLTYHDPEKVLKGLREIEPFFIQNAPNEKIRTLRTQTLKPHLEGRQGALFCLGLSKVVGEKIHFARHEQADYDIVTMFKHENELVFTPVQLKELVPEKLNPTATFEAELEKLSRKYVRSTNLVVAFHLNRRGRFDADKVRIPKLNISELWVFGAQSPDQRQWFLIGDLLKNASLSTFEYPI